MKQPIELSVVMKETSVKPARAWESTRQCVETPRLERVAAIASSSKSETSFEPLGPSTVRMKRYLTVFGEDNYCLTTGGIFKKRARHCNCYAFTDEVSRVRLN